MLPTSHRRPWALSTQGVALLLVLVVCVVLVLLAGAAGLVERDLDKEYEQRALAIARSVAQEPGLGDEVERLRPTPDGPVERAAESVRTATGALYVVVTDIHGIRYSHPHRANIGQMVSTSAEEALAGREVVTMESGTLGPSARGKVPLRDGAGRIVGEVSVGISMSDVSARTRDLVLVLVLFAAGALGLGAVGALAIGWRLRRTTLGLAPEEMADLVREHAAVLGGIKDGIVAVDRRGRVTVVNREAELMLGGRPERGSTLADPAVPELVRDLMAREPAPDGAVCVVGERIVVAHRFAVRRDGRDLGQVLVLRDRSDLDAAARELEATRALTDALRAQAHEHRNRLHALGGLLHLGHADRAMEYLEELDYGGTALPGVADPYLAGLIAAKTAVASESGVTLEVTPSSYVAGLLTAPLDTVTVLANLIDNAIGAAARGARAPRVEVTLASDGAGLVMQVADSGPGVPPEHTERIFDQGVTTKTVEVADHGIGLALARYTARRHGGDVVLRAPGGAEGGAVFEARLEGVLSGAAVVSGVVAP